jgi:hypothetical protein
MCRNIRTLFNFEPPATEIEIRDASLQFVRKLSGMNLPSRANEAAFERAVEQVAATARELIASLVTSAGPRLREVEAARARARAAARFSRGAMEDPAALPGIGPKSRAMLAAGILSLDDLRRLGSVAAYARVRRTGANASLNLLWALEGALSGMRWQDVARRHRTSLLLALESHEAREGASATGAAQPRRTPR